MRWTTYLATLTFGIKSRPEADNVSDSLSIIFLEELDYQFAKNLELQAGLSYLSLAMSVQGSEELEDKQDRDQVFEESIIESLRLRKQSLENHFLFRRCLSGCSG
jgi:hypothetical protein